MFSDENFAIQVSPKPAHASTDLFTVAVMSSNTLSPHFLIWLFILQLSLCMIMVIRVSQHGCQFGSM